MEVNPDLVRACEANLPKDAKLIIGCSLQATQFLLESGIHPSRGYCGGYGGGSDPLGD